MYDLEAEQKGHFISLCKKSKNFASIVNLEARVS